MNDALLAEPAVTVSWIDAGATAPVRSTDGRVVYAVGDVHGCYDLLKGLLEALVWDAASLDKRVGALLVFCGDYVDRGSRSRDVLDTVVWLSRQRSVESLFLKGNHEAMLLGFLDRPEQHVAWLRKDGLPTLRSYGVSIDAANADASHLRDALADRMPAAHLRFLERLPTLFTCGGYAFVHAGLRPGVPLARQSKDDCLWIRDAFLDSDHRFEKVVVHGHSWDTDQPQLRDTRIGVDTGAYATGVLTAVRLDGATVRFLQARAGAPIPTEPRTSAIEEGIH